MTGEPAIAPETGASSGGVRATILVAFGALFAIAAWPASWAVAGRLENRLREAAELAVLDAGAADWARVEVDGQRVRLSGLAPDAAAREELIAAVTGAAGAGVAVVEGVTAAGTDGLKVAQAPAVDFTDARPDVPVNAPTSDSTPPALMDDPSADPIGDPIGDLVADVIAVADGADLPSQGSSNSAPGAPETVTPKTVSPTTVSPTTAPPATVAVVKDAPSTAPLTPAARANACAQAMMAISESSRVIFASNGSTITPAAARYLDAAADVLQGCGAVSVLIAGHTDSTGAAAANRRLSRRRAERVRDALLERGVGEAQLSAEGFGEARPVATNAQARGRALNRRIEILVRPLERQNASQTRTETTSETASRTQ